MKVNFLSVPLNPETTPPDGQAIAIPLGDNGTDPRNILHYVDFATLLKPGAVLMAGDFYGNGRVPGVDGLLGIKIIHSSPNDFDVVQYDASNEELDRGILGNFKLSSIFGGVLAHTGTTEPADRTWFGKLNTFNNAGAIASALDSTLSERFAFFVRNIGAGTVTFTPSTGSINVATLATGEAGMISFDGTNWTLLKFGSSGTVWGTITGTLSDQIDLQSALDAKLDDSQLDTDGTLAANSDAKIASQKAVKTYVAAHSVTLPIAESDVTSLISDLAAKIPLTYLDTDGTLAANSDTKIASQKAVKTYVAAQIAAGGGTVYSRGFDLSDITVNTDAAPHPRAGAAGTISKVTGILRRTITSTLTATLYVDGNAICTINIPNSTAVNAIVAVTSFSYATVVADSVFSIAISASDGLVDPYGIVVFQIFWS
jgi:hypothetical protein